MTAGVIERQLEDAPARQRVRVEHLFWTRELEVASRLGLAVISLCGGKAQKPFAPTDVVPIVGGLMPLTKPRDCRRCVAVYEARARKNWQARQGV